MDQYRYRFTANVPPEDISTTLLLALWGTESLHGETQTRLDASHVLDSERRTCHIDASTPVGRDLNRLFAGFLRRELAPSDFTAEHIAGDESQQSVFVSR